MLAIARKRMPQARLVTADALELPFAYGSFDRVVTGHFYGHLETPERVRFLAEARRVAPELVVIDAALRPDRRSAEYQHRTLNDGSAHQVYKRYFDGNSQPLLPYGVDPERPVREVHVPLPRLDAPRATSFHESVAGQ
jgi:ubiquinone/menaquinone biosynthesis C-methylase UbiE